MDAANPKTASTPLYWTYFQKLLRTDTDKMRYSIWKMVSLILRDWMLRGWRLRMCLMSCWDFI